MKRLALLFLWLLLVTGQALAAGNDVFNPSVLLNAGGGGGGGSGDVVGSGTATDGDGVLFSGASGKVIKVDPHYRSTSTRALFRLQLGEQFKVMDSSLGEAGAGFLEYDLTLDSWLFRIDSDSDQDGSWGVLDVDSGALVLGFDAATGDTRVEAPDSILQKIDADGMGNGVWRMEEGAHGGGAGNYPALYDNSTQSWLITYDKGGGGQVTFRDDASAGDQEVSIDNGNIGIDENSDCTNAVAGRTSICNDSGVLSVRHGTGTAVSLEASGVSATFQEDTYTPSLGQTVFVLSQTFVGGSGFSEVKVNTVCYLKTIDYTISAGSMTWLNTPFSLDSGDVVVVKYQTQ
jgi:hypothetical protein